MLETHLFEGVLVPRPPLLPRIRVREKLPRVRWQAGPQSLPLLQCRRWNSGRKHRQTGNDIDVRERQVCPDPCPRLTKAGNNFQRGRLGSLCISQAAEVLMLVAARKMREQF